jgi:hypothetical protein
MVGSQRVCKRHFQGYSKAQRMDLDEQGYRQYFHIVRVSSTSEVSRDCLRKREQCAYPWRVQVGANAKFDFVSCLEQDGVQETGCYLSCEWRRHSCHELRRVARSMCG